MLVLSCEKNLDLEMREKGGDLVLYSFIAPDSLFQMHLSKSVSHNSVDDFERVYDGSVSVYINSNIVDDFIFPFEEAWISRQDVDFFSGDTVLVEAADGLGQIAWGETVIPHAVPVTIGDTSVVFIDDRINGEEEMMNCELVISDPDNEDNYYQLIVLVEYCRFEDNQAICEQRRVEYNKSDPVFFVQDKEGSLIGGIDFDGCFSDALFDGEDYILEVDLPVEYSRVPEKSDSSRRIIFHLLSHTRDFYDYYRSRVVAEYGYDLPIIDPIRIYNNINGGLGLVSGYNVASDTLVFSN